MGRKENLSLQVPSFFRCPISLDVMRSPVSLCTGVTYDRSSIQRWLDSGNNTCPATMQPLPSADLVPNLNLRRLIKLWADAALAPDPVNNNADDVLENIRTSADPVPSIQKLSAIMTDENIDEVEKSSLIIGPCGGARLLASKLAGNNTSLRPLRVAESVVAVIAKILTIFSCQKAMVSALMTTAMINSSLLLVLKEGSSSYSRENAAAVLNAVISNVDSSSDREAKVTIAETKDLLSELVRVVSDGTAVEAGLSCLVGLAEARRTRIRMVRLGIVSVSTRVLMDDGRTNYAAEKALKLLEVAAGCAGGREEICELGDECVSAVLGSMMRAGRAGTESAVMVLWSVCHLFRDRRATEAVARYNGGLTRMLLLMQGDCAPAVRQMTGDLLRIFRVNSRSCLLGYDTKTTHIMPF